MARAPKSRTTTDLFAITRELLDAFPSAAKIDPYMFTTFAAGPTFGKTNEPDELHRSFRFEKDGCCTHLRAEAGKRSAWRRRLTEGLCRAGYDPWFSDAESMDLRRWLRSSAERKAELAILRELGSEGRDIRWPKRALRRKPPEPREFRPPRAEWRRVIAETQASRVPWDDVVLGL